MYRSHGLLRAAACHSFFNMKSKNLNQPRKDKDWFRLKRYPHIGEPLKAEDRLQIWGYVSNPDKVASHGFYPFIKRTIIKRRFRRKVMADGSRSKFRDPSKKVREIYYANHIDSNIYSYYSELLGKCYEKVVKEKKIDHCISAYRRIPLDPANKNSRNRCNVDFANEVFEYIRGQQPVNLVAITFDVKSFFDTLDHKVLKQRWREILDSGADLPLDHYNVFRNITKFSYAHENQLFHKYKDSILVERSPDIIKPKAISRKKHLRNQRAIAYCQLNEIDDIRQAKLIKANKYVEKGRSLRVRGIPQGSPISAMLANIYMLRFDQAAHEFATSVGGIYRRYSDDMIVVCPAGQEANVIDFMESRITGDDCKLEIQDAKTQIFHFIYNAEADRYRCLERNRSTGALLSNTNFEYLGFQFDGQYARLRNASLAGYYRKMKKTIKRGHYYSRTINNKTKGTLFKRRLYKKFTHLGAQRRKVYKRDPQNNSQFKITHLYDWGNYLSYVYMAARNLAGNKIERQLRNHWRIFHHQLENK